MSNIKKNMRDIISERINIVLNDENLKFDDVQKLAILEAIKAKKGNHISTKINDDGNVYCNYYKTYLPKEEFKQLPNGKYPPMSIKGQKVSNFIKTLEKDFKDKLAKAFLEDKDLDYIQGLKNYYLNNKDDKIKEFEESLNTEI